MFSQRCTACFTVLSTVRQIFCCRNAQFHEMQRESDSFRLPMKNNRALARARGTVSRLASQKPGGAVEAIPSPRYRWLYLKHEVSDALPTSDRLRVPRGDISESVADHPNRAVRTHSTSRKRMANPPPTNQRRSGTTVPLETGTKSSSTAMSL